MAESRPRADGLRIRLLLARDAQSVRLRLPRLFPAAGASLRVFSYDPRLDLPPGVRLEDASAICPDESLTRRFIANGKPSIATFADMFRYRMIRDTGYCWVDTDILCLKKPAFGGDGVIFCRQADAVGTSLVNNAVLRLPPSHPAIAELVATGRGRDRRRPAMGRARPVPADAGPDQIRSLRPRARFACLLPDRAGAVLEALPAGLSGLGPRGGARRNLRASVERSDRVERLRFLGLPARRLLSARRVHARRRASPLPPDRDRG